MKLVLGTCAATMEGVGVLPALLSSVVSASASSAAKLKFGMPGREWLPVPRLAHVGRKEGAAADRSDSMLVEPVMVVAVEEKSGALVAMAWGAVGGAGAR